MAVSIPHHCMDLARGVKASGDIRGGPQIPCATLFQARPAVPRRSDMLSHARPPKVGRWSESALRVLRERYLIREDGQVVETPEEMCWRVARAIASAEERFGCSAAAIDEVAAAFYDMMVEGYFLPNSPT